MALFEVILLDGSALQVEAKAVFRIALSPLDPSHTEISFPPQGVLTGASPADVVASASVAGAAFATFHRPTGPDAPDGLDQVAIGKATVATVRPAQPGLDAPGSNAVITGPAHLLQAVIEDYATVIAAL